MATKVKINGTEIELKDRTIVIELPEAEWDGFSQIVIEDTGTRGLMITHVKHNQFLTSFPDDKMVKEGKKEIEAINHGFTDIGGGDA